MKFDIPEKYLGCDIIALELSVRPYNALSRYALDTIGEVKRVAEEDGLWSVKNFGSKCEEETITALTNFANTVKIIEGMDESALNESIAVLDLPERVNDYYVRNNIDNVSSVIEDWAGFGNLFIKRSRLDRGYSDYLGTLHALEKFARTHQAVSKVRKTTDVNKTVDKTAVNTKASNYDINEIPEKYRRAYTIGAGVIAQEEMKQGLIARAIYSNQSKLANASGANVEAVTHAPKTETTKSINEMTDSQLLKAIEADISIIDCLEDSFVAKYRRKLMGLILNNSTLSLEKRLELIDFIQDIQNNTMKTK